MEPFCPETDQTRSCFFESGPPSTSLANLAVVRDVALRPGMQPATFLAQPEAVGAEAAGEGACAKRGISGHCGSPPFGHQDPHRLALPPVQMEPEAHLPHMSPH